MDGHTLHTWCALDTLFVPERLGRPAQIRSSSPKPATRSHSQSTRPEFTTSRPTAR
ncbi:MAG: organomercurial lyase [Acidimicrobiales bacterium]